MKLPPFSWHDDAADDGRRARDLDRAFAQVERGNSLLLVAERGMGRSYAANTLAGQGMPLISAQMAEGEHRLRRIIDDDPRRPVIVDDAHLLSPGMRAMLRERIVDGMQTVITVRSPRETAGDASDEFLALWRGQRAERIDLGPMSTAEIFDVIAAAVAPASIDTLTLRAVGALSGGSPRRAHELVADAVDGAGVLALATPDPWSLPSLSPRMVELLAAEHAEELDDVAAAAAVVLSEIGTVGRFQAVQLWDPSVIDRLANARLVVKDTARGTLRADPIAALALRLRRPMPLLDRERRRVGAALVEEWQHGLRLEPGGVLYAATEVLRGGTGDAPRDSTASLLLQASSIAARRGLHHEAQRAAIGSLALRDGVCAVLARARAEIGVGELARAARLLHDLHEAALDTTHAVEYAHVRILVDMHRGEIDPLTVSTIDWLRAHEDPDLRAHAVVLDIWSGARRPTAQTPESLRRIAADASLAPSTRLWACVFLIFLLTDDGDGDELAAAIRLGRSLREAAHVASDLHDDSAHRRDAGSLFMLFAGLASMIVGTAMDDLRHDLAHMREDATDPFRSATALERLTVLFLTAVIALIRGDLDTARAELAAASRQSSFDVPPQITGYLDLMRACLTPSTPGSAPITRDLLQVSHATPLPGLWGRFYTRIRAIIGGTDPGTRRLGWLSLSVSYFARILDGDVGDLRDRLLPQHRELTLPRAIAMVAHIEAAATGDPEALSEAAELLARADMIGHALIAHEQARLAFLALRRTAKANESARRAAELAEARGVPDRASADRSAASVSAALTARELEVSVHVADGLSNQEIARRLFLSVRTVESHVLQARAKLGAARREDIAALLARR